MAIADLLNLGDQVVKGAEEVRVVAMLGDVLVDVLHKLRIPMSSALTGFQVSLSQVVLIDVEVPEGHPGGAVAEEFHDAQEADSEAEHLSGVRVPQPMRVHSFFDAEGFCGFFQSYPQALMTQASASRHAEEQLDGATGLGIDEGWPLRAFLLDRLDDFSCFFVDGNDPLVVCLTRGNA